MSAEFSDPRWVYIWPAYGISALALALLVVRVWLRLRRAQRGESPRAKGAPP